MMSVWRPSLGLVACWVGLLCLLALTVTLAYQPLGIFNLLGALAIATVKAGLVGAIFMELSRSAGLVRVFAGAGFFWLMILLWLGLMDFITRA
jgi:cytochrome c oxidase subunit 4